MSRCNNLSSKTCNAATTCHRSWVGEAAPPTVTHSWLRGSQVADKKYILGYTFCYKGSEFCFEPEVPDLFIFLNF